MKTLDDHPPDDLKNPNQRTRTLDPDRAIQDESWRVDGKKIEVAINWNRLGELEKACLAVREGAPLYFTHLRHIIFILWHYEFEIDKLKMDAEFERKENMERFIDLDKRIKTLEKKLSIKNKGTKND